MSKFDRGVFIFIGLGIWALAMTQVFKPQTVDAAKTPNKYGGTFVAGDCPKFIDKNYYTFSDGQQVETGIPCQFALVVTPSELMKGSKYFR